MPNVISLAHRHNIGRVSRSALRPGRDDGHGFAHARTLLHGGRELPTADESCLIGRETQHARIVRSSRSQQEIHGFNVSNCDRTTIGTRFSRDTRHIV